MARRLRAEEIIKLIEYRKKGYSIPEISSVMKIPKTTVYNYIKNVQMPENVLSEWKSKRGGGKKIRLLKEKKLMIKLKVCLPIYLGRRDCFLFQHFIGRKEIKRTLCYQTPIRS